MISQWSVCRSSSDDERLRSSYSSLVGWRRNQRLYPARTVTRLCSKPRNCTQRTGYVSLERDLLVIMPERALTRPSSGDRGASLSSHTILTHGQPSGSSNAQNNSLSAPSSLRTTDIPALPSQENRVKDQASWTNEQRMNTTN